MVILDPVSGHRIILQAAATSSPRPRRTGQTTDAAVQNGGARCPTVPKTHDASTVRRPRS